MCDSKFATSFAFVAMRIVFPFVLDAHHPKQRVYIDYTTCKACSDGDDAGDDTNDSGERKECSMDVMCFGVGHIVHKWRWILYTLFILFCDCAETVSTMLRMNARSDGAKGTSAAILASESHKKWLDCYLSRFAYSALALHFALRGWDVMRNGVYTAIGEFNEEYCAGPDREAHLCYRYNQTQKKKMRLV